MNRLRRWVHHRAHHGPQDHAHVSRQRRAALWMTVFAAVRTVAWVICMLLIAAHWLGAGGPFLHWFVSLSSTVLFVTMISFYCNASTDMANFAASLAALFSADSHATAIAADSSPAEDFARALSANADVLAKLDGLDGKVADLADAVQVVMAARNARDEPVVSMPVPPAVRPAKGDKGGTP
jgi:hypothetical protein